MPSTLTEQEIAEEAALKAAVDEITDAIIKAVTIQKIKRGTLADVITNLNESLAKALRFPKSADKQKARAELVRSIVKAMEAASQLPVD
jgi:hypothetical protein